MADGRWLLDVENIRKVFVPTGYVCCSRIVTDTASPISSRPLLRSGVRCPLAVSVEAGGACGVEVGANAKTCTSGAHCCWCRW